MRLFAVSDIHIDHPGNHRWLDGLSAADYRDDVLILAGDVSDSLALLNHCFEALARRFQQVLFVPGNHDLWVLRDRPGLESFGKLELIRALAATHGVAMGPVLCGAVSIVPLMSWYDESFGVPEPELRERWMDYRACRWPAGVESREVNARLLAMNEAALRVRNRTVVSFSHFVPRLDLLAARATATSRLLQPVMGSTGLEAQLRRLMPTVHVYGHSHRFVDTTVDGIRYVNCALGYPTEQADSPAPLRELLRIDSPLEAAPAAAEPPLGS
ncbi:MAG: metallophosphoesterase [Luteimonas sp.]